MLEKLKGKLEEVKEKLDGGRERCGARVWWDEKCREKKKVRRMLKEWKGGKTGKKRYREEKAKYKEMYERKKREKRRG